MISELPCSDLPPIFAHHSDLQTFLPSDISPTEISDLNTHAPYHTEDNPKSISLANMSAKNSMEVSHGRGGTFSF